MSPGPAISVRPGSRTKIVPAGYPLELPPGVVTVRSLRSVNCPLAGLRRRNGHDPAAGLQEDASARLPEHPALLGCLILRRSSPPSNVGGHQNLADGHEEGSVAITESDRILGTLRCGSAAEQVAESARLISVSVSSVVPPRSVSSARVHGGLEPGMAWGFRRCGAVSSRGG
jgi:hypothetical protein